MTEVVGQSAATPVAAATTEVAASRSRAESSVSNCDSIGSIGCSAGEESGSDNSRESGSDNSRDSGSDNSRESDSGGGSCSDGGRVSDSGGGSCSDGGRVSDCSRESEGRRSRDSTGSSSRKDSATVRSVGGVKGGGKKSGRKQKGEAYIEGDIKLRFLCPDDVEAVKELCRAWFPVEYPDFWYKDITNDKRFFSLAAACGTAIVGLLVAEVKTRARCHREDSNILSATFPGTTQVAYILSLGVVEQYRRKGIASAMLENFLTSLTTGPPPIVKAVYLHVLASNTGAIKFYEKHKFQRHEFLPYYYSIHGQARDGLSYCLYINGGQPPWTLIDYMKHFGSYIRGNQLCNLPHAMARHTRNFFSTRRSWVHLPHLPNMPSMPNMPNINMPNITMPNILSRFRGQGSSAGPSEAESGAGGECSDSASSSSVEAVAVVDEESGSSLESSTELPAVPPEVVTLPMGTSEGAESSSSGRRSWLPKSMPKSMPRSMPSMPKSMPSMPKSMPSMPKSMPSMPSGMSLLTRFGGQCYDSGEQNETDEPEEYTNADHKL